jgi:CRISPR-associated endonuclease/helicase Cas3
VFLLLECLAKSDGETLSSHVKECLNVARHIVPALPLPQDEKRKLLKDLELALALHDVGKAASGFQSVLAGRTKNWNGRRHEIISASFASALPDIDEAVTFAVLTHHKSIPNVAFEEDRSALDFTSIPIGSFANNLSWRKLKSEWVANQTQFQESWHKICQMIGRNDLTNTCSLPELKLDAAWLDRDSSSGQLAKMAYPLRSYFSLLRGLLMTCDHMASGHYEPRSSESSFKEVAISSFGKNGIPWDFQIQMSNTRSSVILRAPTGSGKTEAALLWAKGNAEQFSRLYYVLPNIASINAMYDRLKSIYGRDSVGLLHSRARAAIYRKLETGEDLESKLKDESTAKMLSDLAHAIWFPVRVCTPHQILRFSLRGRGWETMLAEFPNALFVFDEIHAYDPRLVGQILATAKLVTKWRAKCAFLSATMPSFLIGLMNSKILEGNPIDKVNLSFIRPSENKDKIITDKKRHIVVAEQGTLEDVLERIMLDVEKGLRILVVCNTIRASQSMYTKLCEKLEQKFGHSSLDESNIMLIHSRFTRKDRTEKEMRIMNPETQPKILVATQVVEVSLNISYDTAYLEPAPIDAMIQRMGRVNRTGEMIEPAQIHVMSEEISARSVYRNRERVMRSTEELFKLASTRRPLSEGDLITASETVYGEGYSEEENHLFNSGFNNSELIDFESELLAGASVDWKDEVLSDTSGVDVLPSRFLNDFESLLERKLFTEAFSFLVPVQYWSLSNYEHYESHNVVVAYWTYSHKTGLAVDPKDIADDDLSDTSPSTPSNVI